MQVSLFVSIQTSNSLALDVGDKQKWLEFDEHCSAKLGCYLKYLSKLNLSDELRSCINSIANKQIVKVWGGARSNENYHIVMISTSA